MQSLGCRPYPVDFAEPAIAYDHEYNLICEAIQPVKAGAYGSVDGIREAARNRKEARKKVALAEEANAYLDDAAFNQAMSALDVDAPEAPAPETRVVAGHFDSPLRRKSDPESSEPTLEMLNNLDRSIGFGQRRGIGGR